MDQGKETSPGRVLILEASLGIQLNWAGGSSLGRGGKPGSEDESPKQTRVLRDLTQNQNTEPIFVFK